MIISLSLYGVFSSIIVVKKGTEVPLVVFLISDVY